MQYTAQGPPATSAAARPASAALRGRQPTCAHRLFHSCATLYAPRQQLGCHRLRRPTACRSIILDDGLFYKTTAEVVAEQLESGSSVQAAANAVRRHAVSSVRDIAARHANQHEACGYIFEVFVEASFNLDALRKGSTLRAERVARLAHDVHVFDVRRPGRTLQSAQLKLSRRGVKAFKQKQHVDVVLVPEDQVGSSPVMKPVLAYGGVSSNPVRVSELRAIASCPWVMFLELCRGQSPLRTVYDIVAAWLTQKWWS